MISTIPNTKMLKTSVTPKTKVIGASKLMAFNARRAPANEVAVLMKR
jgi:hypothetical protein